MRNVIIVLVVLCSGCASYITPGGPARLDEIDRADIVAVAARQPAANFPASIAIARIQAEDYQSYTSEGVGVGNFRALTTQELVTERQFQHISELPSVRGVAPINRLLLTSPLKSVDDLRLAAAQVQADVLLIYTIDTTFRIEGRAYGPLSVISLGLIPNRDAHITSTASAMFKDSHWICIRACRIHRQGIRAGQCLEHQQNGRPKACGSRTQSV